MPPTPPLDPQCPTQYRHIVGKSGTTAGQHDMSSACRSGWCFVRCTPSPPYAPAMSPGKGICWPRVVLTWVPLTWAHVLLCAIDCLEFSRVLCNRPSSFFICKPQCPPDAPTPPVSPWHPTPVQASSGQEWYYCRSSWHLVRIRIRLMFGQMYPPPTHPGRGI